MGSPQLNQFTVKVAVDVNGRPEGLIYYDSEGCGHESIGFGFDRPLDTLLKYHDNHRVRSHKLEPRKQRCKYLAIKDVEESRCQLNEHTGDIRHSLQLEW